MKITDKLLLSLLLIATGLLCIFLKSESVGVALVVFGVLFVVAGLVDLLRRQISPAVIKIVSGVLLIVFGLTLVKAALYVLASVLLVYGILKVYDLIKCRSIKNGTWGFIVAVLEPLFAVFISVCLFINQKAVVSVAFFTLGCLFLIKGMIDFATCLIRRN